MDSLRNPPHVKTENPQLEKNHHAYNIWNKNPRAQPVSNSEMKEVEEDKYWPLSGKPYFSVVLSKSNLKNAYQLRIPTKLHRFLPSANVPVVLTYLGKTWETSYSGNKFSCNKRLDPKWKAFVIDNDLKDGDACVFELTESSPTSIKFKVQILRGDFPAELLAKVDGLTPDTPIMVD